jgi:hypothetical protein
MGYFSGEARKIPPLISYTTVIPEEPLLLQIVFSVHSVILSI